MTFRAVVAGLGRIGAAYDERVDRPARTHVRAISQTPGLALAAMVDPSPAARAAARSRFPHLDDVPVAETLSDVAGPIDLVVLAAPPGTRLPDVEAALALRPRILVVEKPLALDATVARTIIGTVASTGTELRVNFHRRFDPGHARARSFFAGPPRAVHARYAKGLNNYGSHLIDLLLDWFGPAHVVRAESMPTPAEDPNIGFRLQLAGGLDAAVTALDGVDYDVFDVDVFYPDGRLELAAGGAERRVWRPVSDLHYRGYAHLAVDPARSEASPVGGLSELYRAVHARLAGTGPLGGCDGQTALAGMAIIDAIKRSASAGGRWIDVRETE